MRRVVFVNRFYWPETTATAQLLTDLATATAARGLPVIVITSRAAGSAAPSRETTDGVEIVRISTPRLGEGALLGKAFAFAAFFFGAGLQLLRQLTAADTLVVMTDPPLFGIVGAAIARWKHATLIHWIQDIYPEVAVAVTQHRWILATSPFRNWAWRQASRCVVVSNEMADVVTKAKVDVENVTMICNWPPSGLIAVPHENEQVAKQRDVWGVRDKFVVAYSGNLGRVHHLQPVIAAADLLRDASNIVFVFIGGGAHRDSLVSEVESRRLTNVKFVPAQPRDRLAIGLAVADVHLVTLRPGCESFVFPSKLYGIATAARPVIFVGPAGCEIAQIVESAGLGRAVDDRQPSALSAVIRRMAADPMALHHHATAAATFASEHSAERMLARWQSVLTV